jgi:hypothetical protein
LVEKLLKNRQNWCIYGVRVNFSLIRLFFKHLTLFCKNWSRLTVQGHAWHSTVFITLDHNSDNIQLNFTQIWILSGQNRCSLRLERLQPTSIELLIKAHNVWANVEFVYEANSVLLVPKFDNSELWVSDFAQKIIYSILNHFQTFCILSFYIFF